MDKVLDNNEPKIGKSLDYTVMQVFNWWLIVV